MGLYKWSNGDLGSADRFNGNISESLSLALMNHVRDLINSSGVYSKDLSDLWGEAYIDSDGRNNSVVAEGTYATFDTNKYKHFSSSELSANAAYIVFDATSITNISKFTYNGCVLYKSEDNTNEYVLVCDAGVNEEENRARLYATLFAGERHSGTAGLIDYDPVILEISGNTYLKTSISRDVGGRFWFATHSAYGNSNPTTWYKFTADSTTGNEDQSAWYDQILGRYSAGGYERNGGITILNSTTENGGSSDGYNNIAHTIGYDKSSKEVDNPTIAQLGFRTTNNVGSSASMLLLTKVDGSWAYGHDGTGSVGGHTETLVDFKDDHSVPDLTLASSLPDFSNIIVHTIPSGTFSSTISKAFYKGLYADWEEGASSQYKLTNNTEDSGWLNEGEVSSFTAFTSEPTKCIVKLIPKSVSPTAGTPSIRGFGLRCT